MIEVVQMELQEIEVRNNHVIYFPTKLEKDQGFKCKLTLGSQFSEACERIVTFLNEREMQRMVEDGQFGNLIRSAKDYLNSNQLLWFLMSRQAVDTGMNDLWMVIHKRPVRFSMLEYGLITGLNCSRSYPSIPEDDGFHRTHFRGMDSVSLRDLRARIDDFEEEVGEEVNVEKIKLASLYFVSVVLGPRRKAKKEKVDPQWMRLVNDLDRFNTYPWGRLALEEALFGLRKDLRAKCEEFKKLVKKRKRDPMFSGFGSFHISGFVQPLQILAYELFNGVGETFATRREDADVALPRMCHWVTRKWHKNRSPSSTDVTTAFGSVQWEDICGMLTPTAAELLSVHYLLRDFVVSNECVVTRRMSKLMGRGLKVVCSQHLLDARLPLSPPSPRSPPPSSPPPLSPPPLCSPCLSSPPPPTPPPSSPPPPSPIPRSPTPHSPHPHSPTPPNPSQLQRFEERLTGVELHLASMQKKQSSIIDMLLSLQSDMLSLREVVEGTNQHQLQEGASTKQPTTRVYRRYTHGRFGAKKEGGQLRYWR